MMISRKPHVVVFFGGISDARDLSEETGYWICHYAPRTTWRITPVRVLADGRWQVPLGNLPQQGNINSMFKRIFETVPALTPAQGLDRLLRQPVSIFMNMIRGEGGDDGALHGLAQSLSIPVAGSSMRTCQQTSDKQMSAQQLESIVRSPELITFRKGDNLSKAVEEVRSTMVPPLFVKPVHQEGSVGVEEVTNMDELSSAVKRALNNGDVIIQKKAIGMEYSVTLFGNAKGNVTMLPATAIIPKKSSYYDLVAKRQPGRVKLATENNEKIIEKEVENISREIYHEVGAEGLLSIDLSVSDKGSELLEVNSVPSLTQHSPLMQQFSVGKMHPTKVIDQLLREKI